MAKYFFLLISVFYFCTALIAEESIKVNIKKHTDFSEALKAAKESKKNILMVFSGSDWCANCIKLKKNVLDVPAFESYANENFIILILDFPSEKKNALSKEQIKKNEVLAEKYNPEGSFPRVVILSPDESKLGEIKSYSNETPDKFIESIKKIVAEKK
jgi:thioredoxin-related protein